MDYKKTYNKIIENRKMKPLLDSEYGEKHHIIPRSLGGVDDDSNLVKLSAREHFICHALLAEMYDKNSFEWYKMNHAFMMMKSETTKQNRYMNNRIYELKKKDFSAVMSYSQSVTKNSQYGTCWVYHSETNKNFKINKVNCLFHSFLQVQLNIIENATCYEQYNLMDIQIQDDILNHKFLNPYVILILLSKLYRHLYLTNDIYQIIEQRHWYLITLMF